MKNVLIEYKTKTLNSEETDLSFYISDDRYKDFIRNGNAGFYFKDALHFYGNSNEFSFHSLVFMNELIRKLYGEICKDLTFIAEDVFGNQFCYNIHNYFFMFNIESGELTELAFGFEDFINQLKEDSDYFTGEGLLTEKIENIANLSLGYRYCPKLPFILGGEYSSENLVLKTYTENLEFSSSIYHQIKDLPDGSDFEIKIV
ncbi:SMI1/KNR4 family protein [Flavobacterium sp. TR2]|uniref:SMI1/KNR4 family protein n=1 Tax=Flavobacterium sp. TR2 TaxID=2977321 RepID=UPI0021B0FF42|nr:SMI1/KNR4 family protein [Flavobacterium sp. TR2]UWY30124.1 SMI1/KNR4 family protein [Flavobacterium sp. TR2]